jgi:hypothetical protein
VEDERFIELAAPAVGDPIEFSWDGAAYRLDVTMPDADVAFIEVMEGVARAPAVLHVVPVRRATWRAVVRSWLARRAPRVTQLEARALRVSAGSGDEAGA